LLPPQSEVIKISVAFEYCALPSICHHVRMLLTENCAVSALIPTDTQPLFKPISYTP